MADAYDFTVFTTRPLDEVIGMLNATLTKYGVHARWSAGVSSGLREVDADPGREIYLIEACEPEEAAEALREEPRLSYLIPARVVVFEENEGTFCGFLRPTGLLKALDRPELEHYADRLEKLLRLAVVEATGLEEAGPQADAEEGIRAGDGEAPRRAQADLERRGERPIH